MLKFVLEQGDEVVVSSLGGYALQKYAVNAVIYGFGSEDLGNAEDLALFKFGTFVDLDKEYLFHMGGGICDVVELDDLHAAVELLFDLFKGGVI